MSEPVINERPIVIMASVPWRAGPAARMVKSLLSQTAPVQEIHILADGYKKLPPEFEHVRVTVHDNTGKGLIERWRLPANLKIKTADSTPIIILDDDLYVASTYVEATISYLPSTNAIAWHGSTEYGLVGYWSRLHHPVRLTRVASGYSAFRFEVIRAFASLFESECKRYPFLREAVEVREDIIPSYLLDRLGMRPIRPSGASGLRATPEATDPRSRYLRKPATWVSVFEEVAEKCNWPLGMQIARSYR